MSEVDIKTIIVKFMYNSADASELELLQLWLSKWENEQKLNEFVEVNYAISHTMTEFNTDKIKQNLVKKIKQDKRILNRLKKMKHLKYAAVVITFLGIGYFFQDRIFIPEGEEELIPKQDEITLYLEDGGVQFISKDDTRTIRNSKGENVGTQNGNLLHYDTMHGSKEVVYHKLNVPYGKQFEITLGDGTKVHLNAGSSLKYPVHFLEKGSRNVFLTGEAFFDVVQDAHRPFIVHTDEVNIRVLGTRFNVSSYPEDNQMNTVLVEGAVGLFMKGEQFTQQKSTVLEPGFKASWNKSSNKMALEEVDTEEHVAWISGKMVFNHMVFSDILKKLERHYNVKIINTNKAVDEEVFTASFDTETIEQVLHAFSRNFAIKFHVQNNQVIIN
ncbi:FecR domain-containing protein [Arenibacter sp. GZD96]|uniref:FecR family protein n=1 Tax=Aurantibrevibacter litoralis TaxID=3106030 RepID=UPI002AFEF48E|nr:FecR domain-containing protein [Arenibacter sp. GZD-96]MEA1785736.1 FecR domain-containing protein [Arenibacter sp. GZD-96]